jgi:hypothetical protein
MVVWTSESSLDAADSTLALLVGDHVIHASLGKEVALRAFERDTGNPVWKSSFPCRDPVDPVVATIHGRDQIVLAADYLAVGVDPAAGRELWRFPLYAEPTGRPLALEESCMLFMYANDCPEVVHIRRIGNAYQPELRTAFWVTCSDKDGLQIQRDGALLYVSGMGDWRSRGFACINLASGRPTWMIPDREYDALPCNRFRVMDGMCHFAKGNEIATVMLPPSRYRNPNFTLAGNRIRGDSMPEGFTELSRMTLNVRGILDIQAGSGVLYILAEDALVAVGVPCTTIPDRE